MPAGSQRGLLFAGAAFCFGAVLFAYYYLEHTLYMNPCPLCMMQRLAFVLLGLALLLQALFYDAQGWRRGLLRVFLYGSVFFGMALAARHLYVQSLPPEWVPACGLDFYGLMKQNSLFSGLWQAMQGSGDCATRDVFWGLRLPVWSLGSFVVLLLLAVVSQPPRREA